MNPERARLAEAAAGNPSGRPWRRWGAYLAERQWGTVREDYSADGDAWRSFPFEMASARAYRWGEDGIAGFSDDQQRLCFSVALWNGRDAILKERLFGLSGPQGNHGEDVKELYYYLDALPSHAYLKALYKYPQAEFPYRRLIEENARRDKHEPEFELLDTGVFAADRYFDVFVEYAKADAEDILIRVEAHNRGPEGARLVVLPQLWFRNTWSWGDGGQRPLLEAEAAGVRARHPELGEMWLLLEAAPELLFCDNETNAARLWGGEAGAGYFKDGVERHMVHGARDAVHGRGPGTKVAAVFDATVPAAAAMIVRLRLTRAPAPDAFTSFDALLARRHAEADAFYAELQNDVSDAAVRHVQRQAWAGMVWNEQTYIYDVPRWLAGDAGQPVPPSERRVGRNSDWAHFNTVHVLSMPDKWEFPWFAAWDLGFHCVAMARLDPDLAKDQLVILLREWYQHPSGQLPAYEWSFGDVNPPVHAWAAWRLYQIDREMTGRSDRQFLERVFHKLLINFTWWVNRKDPEGRNVFQGGFLGLDNIGVFDRSASLPAGGRIDQADGTAWMAMYSLNLMRIAIELALENSVYEDIATKFFEHFLFIAAAMKDMGGRDIDFWHENEQFFYDVLHVPDEAPRPLKVRSMVGLIPLFAVEVLEPDLLERVPEFTARLRWFLDHRPDLADLVSRWQDPGRGERRMVSLLRGHRMKRLIQRMVDEEEFLSPHGVRALSRRHRDEPYVLTTGGQRFVVSYQPGESDSNLYGGNSNWRGPVWLPLNFLIVESLRRFHRYYGPEFRIECPARSGRLMSIGEIAEEISRRLVGLFLPDSEGRRPVFGASDKQQRDPHFRDHLLFYEYFHGDTGRGAGASHQTGWTGLVAEIVARQSRPLDP